MWFANFSILNTIKEPHPDAPRPTSQGEAMSVTRTAND